MRSRMPSSSASPSARTTNRISSSAVGPPGGRPGCRPPRRDPRRRVELARPEPHAAAVQRRVGAPRDHGAAALAEHDPVAVTPDAGVAVEVRGPVARVAGVVPEPTAIDGIGWRITSSPSSRRSPRPPRRRPPRRRRDSDPRSRRVHGQEGAALDDAGAHVGPAAAVDEEHVRVDLLVDPLEAVDRQRRAGDGERRSDERSYRSAGLHALPCGTPARTPG